jgi:hypothetical protein
MNVALTILLTALMVGLLYAWAVTSERARKARDQQRQYRPRVTRSDVPGWSGERQMRRDIRSVDRRSKTRQKEST